MHQQHRHNLHHHRRHHRHRHRQRTSPSLTSTVAYLARVSASCAIIFADHLCRSPFADHLCRSSLLSSLFQLWSLLRGSVLAADIRILAVIVCVRTANYQGCPVSRAASRFAPTGSSQHTRAGMLMSKRILIKVLIAVRLKTMSIKHSTKIYA